MDVGDRPDTDQPEAGRSPSRRATVPEAAGILGISAEAVRSRVKRGTLESVKESGKVYVLLAGDRTPPKHDQSGDRSFAGGQSALVDELHARIDSLEHQLQEANVRDREQRRIIAALTSRIPELDSPRRAQDSPREPREGPGGSESGLGGGEPERGSQRPWWRRLF